MASILMVASNLGVWAEELQGPWDVLIEKGHNVTLATEQGIKPLPHVISMDPDALDTVQNIKVNPQSVVDRCKALWASTALDNPIAIKDAKMRDYEAIALIGGPGAPLDMNGNSKLHKLLVEAFTSDKLIATICYAVGGLVWARNPETGKSIIDGKVICAHPRDWDFTDPLPYPLDGAQSGNAGTDLVTPGFNYPVQTIVELAVGDDGRVLSNPYVLRSCPCTHYDWPFVTALSVESSTPFGYMIDNALIQKYGK